MLLSYEGSIATRWVPLFFTMKLIDRIKNWFQYEVDKPQPTELKTIQTLDIFDDVWIMKEGEIYKGWVYDKSRNSITVIYNRFEEARFRYAPSTTSVETNKIKLILNESEIKCL